MSTTCCSRAKGFRSVTDRSGTTAAVLNVATVGLYVEKVQEGVNCFITAARGLYYRVAVVGANRKRT